MYSKPEVFIAIIILSGDNLNQFWAEVQCFCELLCFLSIIREIIHSETYNSTPDWCDWFPENNSILPQKYALPLRYKEHEVVKYCECTNTRVSFGYEEH
jgi:hypothetical protein